MTISYLERKRPDETWFPYFLDELPKKEIHYISMAAPGLTIPSSIVEFAGKFSVDEIYELMLKVNQEQETGTLYPKVNISLMPLPYMRGRFGGEPSCNNDNYSDEQVLNHMADAFKANTEYIKSNKMYFDFRYVCDEDHYISCLELAFDKYNNQGSPKVEIFTWLTEES